jgi:hypothetical protein
MATQKEDIKDLLGRSPDDSDTWIMRMYFTVRGRMLPNMSEATSRAQDVQRNLFVRNTQSIKNDSSK